MDFKSKKVNDFYNLFILKILLIFYYAPVNTYDIIDRIIIVMLYSPKCSFLMMSLL